MLSGLSLLPQTESSAAQSAEKPSAAQSTGQLVMSGDREYPPFHYLDEHGEPTGFDVQMFRYLAEFLGEKYEIRLNRWTDALNNLAAGDVDVVPMFSSAIRAERYEFTAPVLNRHHLVFGNQNAKLVEQLSDLEGMSVLVQAGSYAEDHLREYYPDISLISTSTSSGAVMALLEEKADYALLAKWNALYTIRKNEITTIRTLSPPLLNAEYVFAVPKGNHELVARLNTALSALRNEGVYDRLYNKWLVNLDSRYKYFRITVYIATGILLLLLVYLGYVYMKYRSSHFKKEEYLYSLKDESEKRAVAEEEVNYLAYHDRSTGLFNRNGFVKALNDFVVKIKNDQSKGAVCVVRLVDLGTIEQVGGFDLADLFISHAAKRMNSIPDVVVGRIDREKFGFILTSVNNSADAEYQLKSILEVIEGKIEINNIPFDIRVNAGLALFPEHGYSGKYLLRAADLARHHAYASKRRYKVYDLYIEPDPRNLTLMTDLRQAIRSDELTWVFQPQVRLEDGVTIGAEMLARWWHNSHGFIPPTVFIGLAEESGIIAELTSHLVDKAGLYCEEFCKLQPELSLSINISGNDLEDEELVDKLIAHQGRLPRPICLEITETSVMRNPDLIFSNINRLKAAGYEFSLDDYGTGYSSLSYLRRLKPRELKIDREFIFNLLASEENLIITKATIGLCHALNSSVTAEGAEDQVTIDRLKEMECDVVQGYGISKPLPEDGFREWLRAG